MNSLYNLGLSRILSKELYCVKCLEEDGVSSVAIIEDNIQFCPRCKKKEMNTKDAKE